MAPTKNKLKMTPKEVYRHEDSNNEAPENTENGKKKEVGPVIILAHPRTALRIKREKTEGLLKKSCTTAYKPVVPNDIYKKNFSSNLSLSVSYTYLLD